MAATAKKKEELLDTRYSLLMEALQVIQAKLSGVSAGRGIRGECCSGPGVSAALRQG